MGFFGSAVSGESHHTISSGDEEAVALKENCFGLDGGVILELQVANRDSLCD